MGTPFFIIFHLTHTLWVPVRTASARRSYCVPTIYVMSENSQKKTTPFFPMIFFLASKKTSLHIAWASFRNGLYFELKRQ